MEKNREIKRQPTGNQGNGKIGKLKDNQLEIREMEK